MEEDKKEEKIKRRKKPSEQRNKELFWILFVMASLIFVFMIASSLFKGFHTFKYGEDDITGGLVFTKEMFGEIPVFHYYYYYNHVGKIYQYNLYLRIDPRKNDVPVDGNIKISSIKPLYISVDGSGLTECKKSSIAVAGLSAFFSNNLVEVRGATPRIIEAQVKDIQYATCETHPHDQIIVIERGDETRITKQSDGCYKIAVSNCEILEATEKFIVQSVIDSRKVMEAS